MCTASYVTIEVQDQKWHKTSKTKYSVQALLLYLSMFMVFRSLIITPISNMTRYFVKCSQCLSAFIINVFIISQGFKIRHVYEVSFKLDINCSVHRNILWNNQQMSQCAVKFYLSASPLYMFRAAHTPIIRSTILTVSTAIGTIHTVRNKICTSLGFSSYPC